MPAQQVSKTGLLARLGDKLAKAAAEHRNDKPDFGNPQVPGGIKNGIAQLRTIYIGEYGPDTKMKGQPFFRASATIEEPDAVEGTPVRGLMTSIGPEPLFDTPEKQGDRARKTFSDHWGWMRNQIVILNGGDDSICSVIDDPSVDNATRAGALDDIFNALLAAKIHLRFETREGQRDKLWELDNGQWAYSRVDKSGNPTQDEKDWRVYDDEATARKMNPYAGRDPMVFHTWQGSVDYSPPDRSGEYIKDDSANGAASSSSSTPAPVKPKPAPNGTAKTSTVPTKTVANKPVAAAPTRAQAQAKTNPPVVTKPTPAGKVSGRPNAPQMRTTHVDQTNASADGLEVETGISDDLTAASLADLVSQATNGEQAAVDELSRRAGEVGITDDEIEGAPNWQDLADMIVANGGDGEENSFETGGATEEETAGTPVAYDDWLPVKGDIYLYKTTVTETKNVKDKAGKVVKKEFKTEKDVECEVKNVNINARTVDLYALDTKTWYKGVSFDDLTE